ncbi:hypothetical protein B0O41_3012 [Propionibacteriaceae bacterium ES.041]|uniref:hypothetical protein n=1 Tax=Enemella evansiae TaxID=2016499 RepID=UPI000C00CBC5|nr:hypothetical protein [Enemella evansiae]PFG68179.1 hypothetical protein B0O41_3012 [Propionibacteriaceae bacterium ES.041]
MEITLQYFDGCPNWEVLDQRLAKVLDGRPDVRVVRQRVETAEDAARLRFHGAPTVLIDGVDPFADEHAPVGLACRVFRTPAGLAGSPTLDQLRAVIGGAPMSAATRVESPVGPLPGLPIACALTPSAGKEQVQRWRAFDDEHLFEVERGETRLVVHYARTDDSAQRLRDLVATESECCSFVDWRIDDDHDDLRLVVTGTPDQLAALGVG